MMSESELAFNVNGEPFEVPGAAAWWRVRRLKAKGAPEVVYSREGPPLILSIDADMDDLRREARRREGRYRLDALDERHEPIAGCPAGYVCIDDGDPTVESATVAKAAPVVTTADQALIEAMRIQAGLAQSIVDKFATMLEASAVLLRAAENAGMPRRLPRFFLDVGEDEGGDEGQDDKPTNDEAEQTNAAPKSGLPAIVDSVMAAGATALVNAIVNGQIKIPGGLGALIDCRRAVPKDSGAAAPATLVPGVVPAPGPRDPAPAPGAAMPPVPPPATPVQVASIAAPTAPPGPVAEVPEDLPTIDAATMQHFQTILHVLTLDEQMHVQALAAELPPPQLRTWIQELQRLSVSDGAAKIRAFLREAAASGTGGGAPLRSGTSGTPGSGGVS